MERWLKSAVMMTVMVVWALYMFIGLAMYVFAHLDPPNPALWGIPGGVWLALNPPIPSLKKAQEEESK